MSTITREWLQQTINDYESVRDELPFGLDDYQGNILAALRIALASLEAEPVAWKVTFTQIDREYNTFTGMYSDKAEVERWVRLHKACNFRADITPLYTAKPVPVTPDGWISCSERMPEIRQTVIGWNGYAVRQCVYTRNEYAKTQKGREPRFETLTGIWHGVT
ncbi:DUF551 domain-containing protein, partial [Escherichia coli]|nr:DUF551 domain-containing protein [Escherichia coli]ELF7244017.1 DUF551 domain-containing protein [Escherichia coli]